MQYTERLIAAYEKHANERTPSAKDRFKELEKDAFRQYLKTEQRRNILEIGCGPGFDAKAFQDQGFHVTTVDNTPAMVALAQEKGIAAQLVDCYQLDQLNATFDAVYSMNCLLHIPQQDLGHILQLVADRLAERGLFYLGLWGGDDFEGIWEKDSYTPQRFFSLRSAETLLDSLRPIFQLEYYRRIDFDTYFFNSLIVRKR